MPSTKMQKISDGTSDKVLMRLLQKGHEPALAEIMRRYKHKLFAFICRYVKDEDAAYDILQETFIRVHFKADSYNSNYTFSTWVHKIAINLCRDCGRKQKLQKLFSLDSKIHGESEITYHDILPDTGVNIEYLTDLKSNLAEVEVAIQNLPHKLKTALILYANEGYSQDECAKILGVTRKTVETRIYRARKILLEKVSKKD